MSTVEFAAWRAKLARQTPSVVKQVIIQESNAAKAKLEQKQRTIQSLLQGIEKRQAVCDQLKAENEQLKRQIETLKAVGTPKAIPLQNAEPYGAGPFSLARLSRFVANEFGYGLDDIRTETRTFKIAFTRQVAMYFGILSGRSTPTIGQFWNRDHTVVLHSFRKIDRLRLEQPELAAKIEDIKQKLEKLNAPLSPVVES